MCETLKHYIAVYFVPVSLIGVEGGNATRISRFANYLRNLLPSSDPGVMEMASKAMGHLSMAGDTFTAEYVEFEVKRALEWLGADRNEGRRHASVSDSRAATGAAWFVVEIPPLLVVFTVCVVEMRAEDSWTPDCPVAFLKLCYATLCTMWSSFP